MALVGLKVVVALYVQHALNELQNQRREKEGETKRTHRLFNVKNVKDNIELCRVQVDGRGDLHGL